MNTKITVLMTAYNAERYLEAALDSVLAQTMTDFELLVIDDASCDATPSILNEYAGRDGRLRIIRNETNLGPYPSANRGLSEAVAPIIARLDADDICEPSRLAAQLAYLDTHPRCLLVGSGYRSIDTEGNTRFVKPNPMDPQTAAFVARLRMPMVHPSFCFRAALPDGEPVRYDENVPIAGDYALATTLAATGEIAALDAILVNYRMHADNISNTRLDRQRHYAHRIASAAVAQHYPVEIALDLQALIDVYYRRSRPSAASLSQAVRGLDAASDAENNAPRAIRERAAGILAEAFIGGSSAKFPMAAGLVLHAPRYVPPLLRRFAQTRGWLVHPSMHEA